MACSHAALLILAVSFATRPEVSDPATATCQLNREDRCEKATTVGNESAGWSLLQKLTSSPHKTLAAVEHSWSPEVQAYVQYLEDLESRHLELVATSSIGIEDPPNGTTLFVVLSDSNDYSNRLKWISESWGQDIPPSLLLAVGDAKKKKNTGTSMYVEPTHCPAHTHDGACCKMAEALIVSHKRMQVQPNLKWAYVVDDDTYVRPAALEDRLRREDPKGANKKGALMAITGCGTKSCQGFCGGGGAALSREALSSLIGRSPATYLKAHMETCTKCEMWGDVTAGTQALAHEISITNFEGLNGWAMTKPIFDATLGKDPEPLMFHYIKHEGQLHFLHRLFADQAKEGKDSAAPVEDKHGSCATFKGHTECTSDPESKPWSGDEFGQDLR